MISLAYAANGQKAAQQGGGLSFFLPLVLMMVVFYFFIIRPQKKKQKEHDGMLKALKAGDKIITTGGIIGVITESKDDCFKLEIAKNVEISITKDSISRKI